MKVPNRENAAVAIRKITEYLLSDTHPVGKGKAAFFKKFGFEASEPKVFEAAMIMHADEREVEQETNLQYGIKYELRCELNTPDNRNPCIVSVWMISTGSDVPNLITAYPFKKEDKFIEK